MASIFHRTFTGLINLTGTRNFMNYSISKHTLLQRAKKKYARKKDRDWEKRYDPDTKAHRIKASEIPQPEIPADYQPSKLLLITRIKPLPTELKVHQKILEGLQLGRQSNREKVVRKFAIVKNTPKNCEMLNQVKHLIRVRPIILKNGLPEEGDYNGSFLRETGDFYYTPKIKVPMERLGEPDPAQDRKYIGRTHLEKCIRRNWFV